MQLDISSTAANSNSSSPLIGRKSFPSPPPSFGVSENFNTKIVIIYYYNPQALYINHIYISMIIFEK